MKKLDLVKQEKLINETLNVVEVDSNRWKSVYNK